MPPATARRITPPIGWLVIAAIVVSGGCYLHRLNQTIRNSYAVWWVADMIVAHLKANDGQWPKGWADLRDDYQTCTERSGSPWSFEELSSRTRVDWQAVPAELLTQSEGFPTAPFDVVTLADGTDSHWQSRDPDQIILEYLRASVSADQESANSADEARIAVPPSVPGI